MRMIMHRLIPVLFSAALVALPFGSIAAGLEAPPGQQHPGQATPSQQPPGTGMHEPGAAHRTGVTEDTLEKFADAFSEIAEIRETFTGRLESAASNEEAQALQQQAQQEMVEAVEKNGLSVAEYNMVVAMMEQDPHLRERIIRMTN